MKNNSSIVYYVAGVFLLSVLLKAFGVVDFSIIEYSGYVLVFYGIIVVINHFGNYERIALFSGTTIFMLGILLITISYFEFPDLRLLILPVTMFICSAGFAVLFIEDRKYFLSAILSVIFLSVGLAVIFKRGKLNLNLFALSVQRVVIEYWAVFVITLVLSFLWSRKR
ncbi:MAG: hypothetical protein IPM56_16920 [Ignavibacteriales bacterium]|nr:MAG: hypothetical protein IPM56_16920 [Ignavibacteriales bacterium]